MSETFNFIDGRFVGSSIASTFANTSPATGLLVSMVHEAGEDQVTEAVAAARRALSGPWSRLSVEERCNLLVRVADRIEQRFEEFLAAEVADTGKPASLARHLDIPRGAANFRVFATQVRCAGGDSYVTDLGNGGKAINYSVMVPKGVIGVICPWNLPLLLMTWKVAPALACGNTVVVKPSEETPSTATLLGEIMNEVGVPAGVYNVVHGGGEGSAGAFLSKNPGVDGITFTGETVTGETIMRAAATGVRSVSLELGGKNPALVFADCDLDAAVDGTVRSVFANCGQVCLGTERVYVERSIFKSFVDRLAERAARLVPGDPWKDGATIGPLISKSHRDKVLSFYEQAVADGAEVVCGGGIPDMPDEFAGGAWIQPTIWTNLKPGSKVLTDEIFGPCCHVQPFDTDEEAIALANDTPYGLCATVWTGNLSRAHRMGAVIEAGIVWVNCWFLRDLRTPFGGMKKSGIGREGGHHSLEFYGELRNVCVQI